MCSLAESWRTAIISLARPGVAGFHARKGDPYSPGSGLCGLRLRSLPRPFLAFSGHPTHSYPLRFSITPAMAPCLPQFCFPLLSPMLTLFVVRAEVTIPRALYFLGLCVAPPRLCWVCDPPSSGDTWIVRDSKGYCQAPPLGTSFPNLGQFRPKRPKTGAKGAIRTHRGLHSAPNGRV